MSFPRPVVCCLTALTLVAAGCGKGPATSEAPKAPPPDVVATDRDTSVNPGTDFFEYANGAWLKAHPIPASES